MYPKIENISRDWTLDRSHVQKFTSSINSIASKQYIYLYIAFVFKISLTLLHAKFNPSLRAYVCNRHVVARRRRRSRGGATPITRWKRERRVMEPCARTTRTNIYFIAFGAVARERQRGRDSGRIGARRTVYSRSTGKRDVTNRTSRGGEGWRECEKPTIKERRIEAKRAEEARWNKDRYSDRFREKETRDR